MGSCRADTKTLVIRGESEGLLWVETVVLAISKLESLAGSTMIN